MKLNCSAVALGLAALILLSGCSRSQISVEEPPTAGQPAAVDPSCVEATPEQLAAITATFIAPVDVVAAYQADSAETPGLTFVTVATVGFPEGVYSKTGETPAPGYVFINGVLNTSTGQAMRYSDPAVPNINSAGLEFGAGYDDAADATFACAKASLG